MVKPRKIKRSQLLIYLQIAMLVLCYAALTVALVLHFTDGSRARVITISLLSGVLGFGGSIVGIFVKRALKAENTMLLIGTLLQETMANALSRPMPPVPPPPYALTISPVPGQDYRYAITLHNGSTDTLANGSLDHSGLLHPGKFGLDDTHMPRDIWVQPPVRFDLLAPGAEITWEVDGYNEAPKYDGPRETRVTIDATRIGHGRLSGEREKLAASVRMAW